MPSEATGLWKLGTSFVNRTGAFKKRKSMRGAGIALFSFSDVKVLCPADLQVQLSMLARKCNEKECSMKKLLVTVFVFCLAGSVLADDHGNKIAFEKRQDSAKMEVTSVHLTETGGTIMAEGQMGSYGRTYVTYTLTAIPGGTTGRVKVSGRGAMEDGSFASGNGEGIYSRNGTIFKIHFLVNMQDGTQNLDEVIFNAFTRELSHDVYIIQ